MARPTLSIAIIAKNEADRIGRLLESARFADEILVVDSGSTDGTQPCAAAMGPLSLNTRGLATQLRNSLLWKKQAPSGCSASMPMK